MYCKWKAFTGSSMLELLWNVLSPIFCGGFRGGADGVPPAQNVLNFMQLFWKIWQICMLPPPRTVGAPHTGNPGSAPDASNVLLILPANVDEIREHGLTLSQIKLISPVVVYGCRDKKRTIQFNNCPSLFSSDSFPRCTWLLFLCLGNLISVVKWRTSTVSHVSVGSEWNLRLGNQSVQYWHEDRLTVATGSPTNPCSMKNLKCRETMTIWHRNLASRYSRSSIFGK